MAFSFVHAADIQLDSDERAAAALMALNSLSAKTQVIFFTHHCRLGCDGNHIDPGPALRDRQIQKTITIKENNSFVQWEVGYNQTDLSGR